MKKITITTKDGNNYSTYLFDVTKEKCPLCGTPLKDTRVRWNMFHGEVNRDCCNSPWQIKDYYVDDDKKEAYQEYFNEVNKPNMAELKIDKELWKKIRKAFAVVGINDCQNEEVYKYVLPDEKVSK